METATAVGKVKRRRVMRKFIRTRVNSQLEALYVHLGMRTRNPQNGSSMHWGEKRRQKEKFAAAVLNTDRPLAVSHITFVRWAPRGFDDDGLIASMKWVRDAACEWLGIDDGPTCGVTFAYEQHKHAEYGVSVRFA